MTKVKKAQMGSDLKPRQYKRLGRIEESNPNRANKVADRMKDRATREQRGKKVAESSGSRTYAVKDAISRLNNNSVREDYMLSKNYKLSQQKEDRDSMKKPAVKKPAGLRPPAKFNIPKIKKSKNGSSFPDLNKDGKITKADILKGRGVIKNGGKVKKAQAGLTASNKRVGPIDPKGAWTKVQEMNLPPRNVKTKVSLTRDKQLGATKMMKMGGKAKAKKK